MSSAVFPGHGYCNLRLALITYDYRPTKAFTCSSKAENPGALQIGWVMLRTHLTLHLCLPWLVKYFCLKVSE
jgi:hypothetical protein